MKKKKIFYHFVEQNLDRWPFCVVSPHTDVKPTYESTQRTCGMHRGQGLKIQHMELLEGKLRIQNRLCRTFTRKQKLFRETLHIHQRISAQGCSPSGPLQNPCLIPLCWPRCIRHRDAEPSPKLPDTFHFPAFPSGVRGSGIKHDLCSVFISSNG